MRSCVRRVSSALLLALALTSLSAGARAAELYVSGNLGISFAKGDADYSNSLGLELGGSDDDQSPVYGGAIGMSFPLHELLPWRLRLPSFDIPYYPGKAWHVSGSEDWRFPGWRTQFEIEGQTGRDFEIITDGPNEFVPFVSRITSHSFMFNTRVDVPIQAPLHVFFGRLPFLEPVTLYGGAGVGASLNELESTDTTLGKDSDKGFTLAWQGKAGIGYALTDNVHLSLGYLYYDLGALDTGFGEAATAEMTVDLVAHEFTSGITIDFYRIPFLGE
jgi:opacity protein-like surface antigen